MNVQENLALAIMTKYPSAILMEDFIVRNDGEGQYISEWNLPYPQPTIEELEATFIDFIKKNKLDKLNEACNEQILNGFTSASTGFVFEFETHDQSNFTQQAILLLNDPTINSIPWKTLNMGIQNLTRSQYFTILKESETHKRNAIGKFWTLKAQVMGATTVEEIDAINW